MIYWQILLNNDCLNRIGRAGIKFHDNNLIHFTSELKNTFQAQILVVDGVQINLIFSASETGNIHTQNK